MVAKYDFLWIKKTIEVTSAPAGTGNTTVTLYKKVHHFIIEAPNTSATFKAQITDADGDKHTREMRATSSSAGLLSIQWGDGLPFIGEMTISISSATVDGDYKLAVIYENT